jgi:hypothetical protein
MKRPARSPSKIGGSRLRCEAARKNFPTKVPCNSLISQRENPRKSKEFNSYFLGMSEPGSQAARKSKQIDRTNIASRCREGGQPTPSKCKAPGSVGLSVNRARSVGASPPRITSFPRASSGRGALMAVSLIHATSARVLVSIAFKRSFHDSTNDFAPATCRSAPSFARSTPALLIAASVSAASPPSCGRTPSSSP